MGREEGYAPLRYLGAGLMTLGAIAFGAVANAATTADESWLLWSAPSIVLLVGLYLAAAPGTRFWWRQTSDPGLSVAFGSYEMRRIQIELKSGQTDDLPLITFRKLRLTNRSPDNGVSLSFVLNLYDATDTLRVCIGTHALAEAVKVYRLIARDWTFFDEDLAPADDVLNLGPHQAEQRDLRFFWREYDEYRDAGSWGSLWRSELVVTDHISGDSTPYPYPPP